MQCELHGLGDGRVGKVRLPMMAKNTLPSYHPAFTAPRRAVGRVEMVGCLNWSRPFVYLYVSIDIEKPICGLVCMVSGLAYCVSQSKHAVCYGCCEEERVFVGGCRRHCMFLRGNGNSGYQAD
jgi:hypothetical protein